MSKIRVLHYINQFFGQIGGEEKADYEPEIRDGQAVGPGMALRAALGEEAEIIATVICGDSYFNENTEEAKSRILAMVKKASPDVFIAGPAFNAGRYGVACASMAAVSRWVQMSSPRQHGGSRAGRFGHSGSDGNVRGKSRRGHV